MRNKFKNKAYFADKDKDYTLFPFNFERLSQDEARIQLRSATLAYAA